MTLKVIVIFFFSRASLTSRALPIAVTDWDAPEASEPRSEPRRGVKRRLVEVDAPASPEAETIKFGEDEDRWTSRSKLPKMKMYSDDVESKKSAKQRIFKSLKRKVENPPKRVEIHEEDLDEDELERSGDMRQKLNLKVQARSNRPEKDAQSRLSDKFTLSKDLRSRLGEKQAVEFTQSYDSGDSLERDDGADLDIHADKMLIQVTQSDSEKSPENRNRNRGGHHRPAARRASEEAMEEDEELDHRDVDHRRKKPKDLRSKISSEIVQIKKEKEDNRSSSSTWDQKRREQEERESESREARRRQRSERRLDTTDQEERRRRREHERR